MIWPFENDTSAIIKNMAQKSIAFDKKKNLFCISAIVVAVAMIMMSLLTVQNIIHQNQNEVSGLHQGIFFDITQKDKENLSSEEGVQSIGLSCNIKTVEQNSKELSLIYYDDTMFNLIPDFEGKYPEQSNEIAVTDAFFEGENVPAKINTTIQLNLDGTVKKYTIVGIYHDQDASAYPVFVSFAKCQELRGNDLLNGYVWLENADTFTKDEAEELLSQISENTGLKDWTVSSYYDYVNTGLSVSNYAAYIVLAGILFLAAALVIYSIFYISVGQKVAEFGQLRTIGASKKQIYKIVLKQGYILASPGILIGSIVGTIISYCLQSKGWSVFAFAVSLCGASLFGILLVYISVRKPARIAANVSPIAALKNQVETINYRSHKRHRITPAYLAKISFFRNRKKSVLTILSMGLCGIIFFFAASYQSSFNAESMARYWDIRHGDFKISVDLENDSENLDAVLRKEYFSDLNRNIATMDGVRNVFTYAILPAEFSTSNDVADETLLMGYNEKDMDSLTTAIVSGNITENTELIVSDPDRVYDVYHWKPQIGNTVTFNFKNNSGKTITKTFKIGAITSSNDGMGGYIFRMPEKMMHELVGYDCTYAIEVQTEPESIQEAENKIRSLIAGNDEVSLQTLQDFKKEHQEDNQAGFTLAYIISAILWVFAVINQINLTVTNLLSQKQEMGTLKSIGMTNKQLEQSFMIEGLFNTGISLFMTIIIGIPGGYMIGTFLEKAGMSTGFVFPTRAFLLFVTVMLLLEVLMTILLIHSWKKQSVIEIMRN